MGGVDGRDDYSSNRQTQRRSRTGLRRGQYQTLFGSVGRTMEVTVVAYRT